MHHVPDSQHGHATATPHGHTRPHAATRGHVTATARPHGHTRQSDTPDQPQTQGGGEAPPRQNVRAARTMVLLVNDLLGCFLN